MVSQYNNYNVDGQLRTWIVVKSKFQFFLVSNYRDLCYNKILHGKFLFISPLQYFESSTSVHRCRFVKQSRSHHYLRWRSRILPQWLLACKSSRINCRWFRTYLQTMCWLIESIKTKTSSQSKSREWNTLWLPKYKTVNIQNTQRDLASQIDRLQQEYVHVY